jgi:DNA helicase II / ATP-dependent DNA helicase PcrA
VVVPPGATPGAAWAGCTEYLVDAALLADSERLATVVDELHAAWVSRTPVIIRLAVADAVLGEAEVSARAPWEVGGEFTFLRERLHHLVWANSYDARPEVPVWWWGRKALRLGAQPGSVGDVVLPDGSDAWIDGGPRGDAGYLAVGPVVHSESVADGVLEVVPAASDEAAAELATDQRAAVMHRAGAARVIAPAGSGKTRTLTARLTRLLDDLAYPRESVTAVAYNTRAAAELSERVGPGRSRSVSTLHSLGRRVLFHAKGNLDLLSERDVRRLLDPMVPAMRRPNTDVIGPYVEAMSEVRIGLRSPAAVESERDDIPGFAEVFERYRERLHRDGVHDFDEQIFGAIEVLLSRPDHRKAWQAACRHLLVDEFQDLTPAYLLLIRLLASPGLDVFGVGDDDQVIYGYAGADPSYLIEFDRLFPGAGHHALEVNYRCPQPVVEGAAKLLSYNQRRIDKAITSHQRGETGLDIHRVESGETSRVVVDTVSSWRTEEVALADMAVLCRVNSALLPVHAAMVDAGIPIRSPIGPPVLERTVMSAALAWIRIGLDPDQIIRDDLFSVVRRPSRGLGRVASDLIGRNRSVSGRALKQMRHSLDGRQRDRWDSFCADVDLIAEVCAGGDARQVVTALASDVGLDRAAAALDSGRTRADRSGQSDDLRALGRAAALHPDLSDFEPWLRSVVRVADDPDGLLLTTVHRVKGLEWDRVIIYGADTGLMPHELADDREEERRVFHVALTRGRERVVVVADKARPSRFVDETLGVAPRVEEAPVPRRVVQTRSPGIEVTIGDVVTLSGGFRGVVERVLPVGVLVALQPGPGRLSVAWGESITVDGRSGPLAPAEVSGDPELIDRLKAWRLEMSRGQKVPAYVVLTDASLEELARRRPRNEGELLAIKGIGPAKLEAYGDDLLALVADR